MSFSGWSDLSDTMNSIRIAWLECLSFTIKIGENTMGRIRFLRYYNALSFRAEAIAEVEKSFLNYDYPTLTCPKFRFSKWALYSNKTSFIFPWTHIHISTWWSRARFERITKIYRYFYRWSEYTCYRAWYRNRICERLWKENTLRL